MHSLQRTRRSAGDERRQLPEWRTGRYLRRLVAVAVVPIFGVATTLVPVSASAAAERQSAASAVATTSMALAGTLARAAIAAAPQAPAKPSTNFWVYSTIKRESQISQDDDYNFSAKMTNEMEKVTQEAIAKRLSKLSAWLSLLSAAIYAFVHSHPEAAAIVAFIAGILGVISAKKVAKLAKWLHGVIYKGKHRRSGVQKNGFWVKDFTAETDPPDHYEGWTSRTCATDSIKCGSPGDHNKEYWP